MIRGRALVTTNRLALKNSAWLAVCYQVAGLGLLLCVEDLGLETYLIIRTSGSGDRL